jgi:hypothetical protein
MTTNFAMLNLYNKTMKQLFFIIMLSVSLCGHAQVKDSLLFRNEISLGFGVRPMITKSWDEYRHLPEIHGQYIYNVSNHVGLGLMSVFEMIEDRYDRYTYVTVNPVIRYRWLNTRHFAAYSKFGAGIAVEFGEEDEDRVKLASNLVLLGLEYGGSQFRVFTDIVPIGTVGLLNIGLKLSF